MKNFDSKFQTVCEETLYRYQQGGFLRGDYVTIKKDALGHEAIKKMSEPLRAIIEAAMKNDTKYRISYIKSGRSEAPSGPVDAPNIASCSMWADIILEYAPGMWKEPLTLPLEILEKVVIEGEMNMYPQYSDDIKRPNDLSNDQAKSVDQTKGGDTNRTLAKSNTKLANTSAPTPGDSTTKLHESVKMLRENDMIFETYANSIDEGKNNQQKYCKHCDSHQDCTEKDGKHICRQCGVTITVDEGIVDWAADKAKQVGQNINQSFNIHSVVNNPEKLAEAFTQLKRENTDRLKSVIKQLLDQGYSDQVGAAVSFQQTVDNTMGDQPDGWQGVVA